MAYLNSTGQDRLYNIDAVTDFPHAVAVDLRVFFHGFSGTKRPYLTSDCHGKGGVSSQFILFTVRWPSCKGVAADDLEEYSFRQLTVEVVLSKNRPIEMLSTVPPGLIGVFAAYPGLTSWALLCRPSGARDGYSAAAVAPRPLLATNAKSGHSCESSGAGSVSLLSSRGQGRPGGAGGVH